jgi:hypothetical protein
MKEGLDKRAAVGKCEGMFTTYSGREKPKAIHVISRNRKPQGKKSHTSRKKK